LSALGCRLIAPTTEGPVSAKPIARLFDDARKLYPLAAGLLARNLKILQPIFMSTSCGNAGDARIIFQSR
jgi:hypothetical protein